MVGGLPLLEIPSWAATIIPTVALNTFPCDPLPRETKYSAL